MYDFAVVGAGLFGATVAYELSRAGKKVLVVEKRRHVGGNCYTEEQHGIHVHQYGPHIFHTSSKPIWDYVNQFATFNNFVNRVKAYSADVHAVLGGENTLYSLPINLMTLQQLYGVSTPLEAKKLVDEQRCRIENPRNLEEWCLSQIGRDLYERFIYGYTKKQWMREPRDLPAFIIKRIPLRLHTFDDNYYDDMFQGVPVGGYTQIFEKMLDGIEVRTETDFFDDRSTFERLGKRIVYSGKLDELFGFSLGELEYRTLSFEQQTFDYNYQGNAQVNYCDEDVPYTRVIEHVHFELPKAVSKSVVTWEYPAVWTGKEEPFYPVRDEKNDSLAKAYKDLALKDDRYVLGGRLGTFQYYDMHQVVGQAFVTLDKLVPGWKNNGA